MSRSCRGLWFVWEKMCWRRRSQNVVYLTKKYSIWVNINYQMEMSLSSDICRLGKQQKSREKSRALVVIHCDELMHEYDPMHIIFIIYTIYYVCVLVGSRVTLIARCTNPFAVSIIQRWTSDEVIICKSEGAELLGKFPLTQWHLTKSPWRHSQ